MIEVKTKTATIFLRDFCTQKIMEDAQEVLFEGVSNPESDTLRNTPKYNRFLVESLTEEIKSGESVLKSAGEIKKFYDGFDFRDFQKVFGVVSGILTPYSEKKSV